MARGIKKLIKNEAKASQAIDRKSTSKKVFEKALESACRRINGLIPKGGDWIDAGTVKKVARGRRIPFEDIVKALARKRIYVMPIKHYRRTDPKTEEKQAKLAKAINTVRTRIAKRKDAGSDKKGQWITGQKLESIAEKNKINLTALEQALYGIGIRIKGKKFAIEHQTKLGRVYK